MTTIRTVALFPAHVPLLLQVQSSTPLLPAFELGCPRAGLALLACCFLVPLASSSNRSCYRLTAEGELTGSPL